MGSLTTAICLAALILLIIIMFAAALRPLGTQCCPDGCPCRDGDGECGCSPCRCPRKCPSKESV